MPRSRQQKIRGENNSGLYQVQPSLSTEVVSLSGIDRWLLRVLAETPPHVWLLSGPIGAGKTTLVKHLATRLGVGRNVTSPTFALQKIHFLRQQVWRRLVHVDAYRIKTSPEVAALELDEYIADPETLLVVEWPERLPGVLWGHHLSITLAAVMGASSRKMTVARLG